MKKFFILAMLIMATIISSYSIKSPLSNPNAPTTNTGAPTNSRTCVRCHGDFALNTPGGAVAISGLPVGSYVPGQVYNLSVTISNAITMQRWGFAMKAVITGTSGTALGTFSTTNPNTSVSAGEIRNTTAIDFTGTSYTYTNLRWTAPSTGSSAVSFYVAGIAADADDSEAGDYSYSNVYSGITLPVSLGEIKGKLDNNSAIIEWNTYSEAGNNFFDLERSADGINFESLKTITASGNSSTIKNYKWIDNSLPKNEQTLYYRLKMYDLNGKVEYSKVIILKPSLITSVDNIYPTVLTRSDLVKVNMISSVSQVANISIYAPGGQKIAQQVQMLQKGTNNFTIKEFRVSGNGIYILKIQAGNFSEVKRLIIQ